jgi:hypothetical protein
MTEENEAVSPPSFVDLDDRAPNVPPAAGQRKVRAAPRGRKNRRVRCRLLFNHPRKTAKHGRSIDGGRMSLTDYAWLALAAYAAHMLEEYMFDWRNWARTVIGLPVEWSDFYMVNATVVVLGIVQAALADSMTVAPLTFAALMLINASFFHVLPFIKTRGRFSPGLFTAVLLFYPLGIAELVHARAGIGVIVVAFAVGAILMASPVVFLKLKSRPYFRQT